MQKVKLSKLYNLILLICLLTFVSCKNTVVHKIEISPVTTTNWKLINEYGSAGQITENAFGNTDNSSLLLEKSNGLGNTQFALIEQFIVAPEVEYEVAVSQQLKERVFGSTISFQVQEFDGNGKTIGDVRYSPWYAFVPNYSKGNSWDRHFMRWITSKDVKKVSVALRIEGNPMIIAIDDMELIKWPKSNDWPGKKDSKESKYNESEARKALTKRIAQPATIEMIDNSCQIKIGDKFSSTVMAHTGHGEPRIRGFGKAGYNIQSVGINLEDVFKNPDKPDFSSVDRRILEALSANPDVHVILQIDCDAPDSWTEKHPNDVWTAENGGKWVMWRGSPNRIGKVEGENEAYAASYGSIAYRNDMGETLAIIGKYLKDSEVGKVVVGFLFFGGNDGQWYDNSQIFESYTFDKVKDIVKTPPVQLDHSEGHQQGFREWLRGEYNNDVKALQTAWNNSNVNFETATVCSEADRMPEGLFLGKKDRRAFDSNNYAHSVAGILVKHFSSKMKSSIGRPVVVMRYHPDASEGYRLNTWNVDATFTGENKLDMVLEAQQYGFWRKLGSTGGTVSSWGHHRLNGTMSLADLDNRSYRSEMKGFWNQYGLPGSIAIADLRSMLLRDVGAAASRGMGVSVFDIMAGTWDSPELWEILVESKRVLDWASKPESPKPIAKMAVFVDETAGISISPEFHHLFHGAGVQRWVLGQCGVSYDAYFLNDICNPNLPDYQMYVFLSAFTLTKAQVEAIETKCRKAGKVVVFTSNLGYGSLDFPDPAKLAERLTGIKCEQIPAGKDMACGPVDINNAIVKGIDGNFIHEGKTDGYSLSPNDNSAVIFGRYVNNKLPSHAMKVTDKGIGVIVTGFSYKSEFTPTPITASLPPVLINNIARMAGIKMIATPEQVTYAGAGVAVFHRIKEGDAMLEFESPVDLYMTDGKTIKQKAVTLWIPECALLETDIVLYRPSK